MHGVILTQSLYKGACLYCHSVSPHHSTFRIKALNLCMTHMSTSQLVCTEWQAISIQDSTQACMLFPLLMLRLKFQTSGQARQRELYSSLPLCLWHLPCQRTPLGSPLTAYSVSVSWGSKVEPGLPNGYLALAGKPCKRSFHYCFRLFTPVDSHAASDASFMHC